MTDSDFVHRLLFYALLDIRFEAHETGNKPSFHLANLFHNVVPYMEKANRGECSFADVREQLYQTAAEKSCLDWVNHRAEQIESNQP